MPAHPLLLNRAPDLLAVPRQATSRAPGVVRLESQARAFLLGSGLRPQRVCRGIYPSTPQQWRLGPVHFAARYLQGDLWLYGVQVKTVSLAEHIIRAMLREKKPRTVTVDSALWRDAAQAVFGTTPRVRGAAYIFDVPVELTESKALMAEASAKAFFKRVQDKDDPVPVEGWSVNASIRTWRWRQLPFLAGMTSQGLFIGGDTVTPKAAALILRRMLKKLKPERVLVNPGPWPRAAEALGLKRVAVSGAAQVFSVPQELTEGTAKDFLLAIPRPVPEGGVRITVGGSGGFPASVGTVTAQWYRDWIAEQPGIRLLPGRRPPPGVDAGAWQDILEIVERSINENGEIEGDYDDDDFAREAGRPALPYFAWEYVGGSKQYGRDYLGAQWAPSRKDV